MWSLPVELEIWNKKADDKEKKIKKDSGQVLARISVFISYAFHHCHRTSHLFQTRNRAHGYIIARSRRLGARSRSAEVTSKAAGLEDEVRPNPDINIDTYAHSFLSLRGYSSLQSKPYSPQLFRLETLCAASPLRSG